MNLIKEHSGFAVFTAIMLLLSFIHKDTFFLIVLFYILLLNILLSSFIHHKHRTLIARSFWCLVILIGLLTYCVNNYMPHGAWIDPDCISYQGDPRGDGGENECVEDTRDLNIPDWATFIRNNGIILLLALSFAAICASNKNDGSN